MGGGTLGMDELVPAPDVRYPATPGPVEQHILHTTISTVNFQVFANGPPKASKEILAIPER